MKSVPAAMVSGVFWWGAEYPGSWNYSLFDSQVNVLPAAGAFGQMAAPVLLNPSRTGTNLTLTWPLSGVGMSLESAPAPNPPWASLTNVPQTTGTVTGLTLPVVPNSNAFYRLHEK